MEQNTGPTLAHLFAGWEGYNQSILSALAPLSAEQLAFRPAANLRSVGELARHIAFGRITWWARMNAPAGTIWFTRSNIGNRMARATARWMKVRMPSPRTGRRWCSG